MIFPSFSIKRNNSLRGFLILGFLRKVPDLVVKWLKIPILNIFPAKSYSKSQKVFQ